MKKETKENIQYGSAGAMLLLGTILSIAGFITAPAGEIHESVLWLFAQCLIYAGSVFGISVYMSDRFNRIEKKLNLKNGEHENQ
jgi:hypothetical protein